VIGARPLYLGNSITLPDGYHVPFVATANSAIVVANALAAVLNTVSSPVTAVVTSGGTASAASVVLTTKATGADQNGAISLSLVSTKVTAAPASLSGGAGTTYDTGSVTANVNGTAVSVGYGQASTPQSVAAALATAISGAGAGVTATAASAAITVTAIETGTAANGWPVTLSSATDQPKFFSAPSFAGTSGTLGGGVAGSTAGPIYEYSIPSTTGYDAHGNLKSYSDCPPNMPSSSCMTGTWTMTYDNLNRVSSATTSLGPWSGQNGQTGLSLGWTYDSFGNRTSQTTTGFPASPAPPSLNWLYPSKNQATTLTYDPSGVGFVIGDASNQYAYDTEGRLCAVYNPTLVEYTEYVYDAEGRRVAKGMTNSLSCNPTANYTQTESYVLGQSGEHISELDGSGNFLRSHVYANGQLLATYVNNSTEFAFSDWLGTKRVVANPNGGVAGTCINLPFGDELICEGSMPVNGHHFTGQIHDAESGNDYFGARYYSEYTGRFLSPDWDSSPVAIPYADRTNPQSFNLYSYAGNNPLSKTDPDGHCTNGGQQKGFFWCLFNDSDQDADRARQQLAQYKNISINGKTPADAAKGLSNTQTVQLERSVFNYISSQAMSSPGMVLALAIVPGAAEELVPTEAAAAADSGSLLDFNKSLASQEQMGELAAGKGTPIAGAGTKTALRDADRLAAQYGGQPGDWQKVASENYNPGGAKGGGFETHAYQNVKTGQVVEMKTKFQ
jgi:RHS repeat-associated protein